MRALLISNSGRPFLEHCREAMVAFAAPGRRLGFIGAATLGDERLYCDRVREALAPVGFEVEHVYWRTEPLTALASVDALFVGGGNTYALLKRLRESRLLGAIQERVGRGLPYMGSSAGANVAGPTILTTNDWNVVALDRFEALSETRDDRIREYHAVNANPVLGIEEQTMVRVENGAATAMGRGRVKVFRRGAEPAWVAAGARLPGS